MTIKQITPTGNASIPIGKQGENNVREILFPQSSDLMACDWVLNHQRAMDKAAYPVPLKKRGNTLVWLVTSGDTAIPGNGLAELTCNGPDGQVLKSQTYSTVVLQSPAHGGEPPDPVKPWYQMITALLRGKMDEPEDEGKAGQFLQTDGKGGRHWADGGWPPGAAELLITILTAGAYTSDQTENIAALADLLGVFIPTPIPPEPPAPKKLGTPVIQIVEEADNPSAVLGVAILGQMVLGQGSGKKLSAPVIQLFQDAQREKLNTPVIHLESDAPKEKLEAPTIRLEEIAKPKLATPAIALQEG